MVHANYKVVNKKGNKQQTCSFTDILKYCALQTAANKFAKCML